MGVLRTLIMLLSPRFFRGRPSNLYLLWKARRSDTGRKVLASYFDSSYYLGQYPDIGRTGVNPFCHYLLQGFHEGRNPSARFRTRSYIRRYPDVSRAGLNPLLHYAAYGTTENRSPGRSAVLPLGTSDAELHDRPVILQNTPWTEGAPLVSLVITCFNYGVYVEQAIRSVLSQTFSNFEIVVVEGGSTDKETVRKIRELEQMGLPHTRFLYRSEAHLAGDNRNHGISAAGGRYICCLDADDLLKPVYIEAAVFLAESYRYDIVYPSVQSFSGSNLTWVVEDAHFPDILDANPISTVALFRKSAWAQIGGYRDWGLREKHVPEDWDFWVRLLGHGFRTKCIPAPLMLYRVHNQGLVSTCETDIDYQRQEIEKANAVLLGNVTAETAPPEVHVVDPWINLQMEGDEKLGFLLALPFITLGGAEMLLRTLSRALVDRGYRLIVITTLILPPAIKDDIVSFEEITPHVYPLPLLFGEQEERWEAFLRYLLAHYNVRTIMLAGCEFFYHILPAIRHEFPAVRIVDQLFNDEVHLINNRHYAQDIEMTIVPSRPFAEALLGKYGESPQRVSVIPHGVCTNGPQLQDRAAALASSGLPADGQGRFLVSFFGRLSEEKAPDVFVEIARRLKDHAEIYFCMTGEGPARPAVLKLIDRYKLRRKIYAPGFVDNFRTLMELSDVIVVPSRIDGMPLVVLEAQALGKPVVASAVGSVPEMIQDNESGFLCEPGNVSAFCQRILELLESPDKRAAMGAAAQRAVRQRHDVDTMINAYVEVFQNLHQLRS